MVNERMAFFPTFLSSGRETIFSMRLAREDGFGFAIVETATGLGRVRTGIVQGYKHYKEGNPCMFKVTHHVKSKTGAAQP